MNTDNPAFGRPHLTIAEAIAALDARLSGTFDAPALVKFGPLGETVQDLRAIVATCPELVGPPTVALFSKLREPVEEWPQFEGDDEVSGADLVEWFAIWRASVVSLLNASPQPETTWDNLTCETALCVWEAMLDIRDRFTDGNGATADAPSYVADMEAAWSGNGAFGMRCVARYLALELEEIWSGVPEDTRDGITFDWEFVPMMLEFVDWSGIGSDQRGHFLPDAAAQALAYCEAEQDRFGAMSAKADADRAAFADWLAKARRACGRIWGYPDLVNDEPTRWRDAFDRGDNPEEFARSEGEDLELSEPDPITAQSLAELYKEPPMMANGRTIERDASGFGRPSKV